jgi:magnesium transporter
MDPPIGVFPPHTTVTQAIEKIRSLVKRAFITYGFVTDADGRLIGVLVMRELMLARPDQTLDELILRNPFYLNPQMPLMEAMKAVIVRHYPVYPVCDDAGRLVGLVRGQTLFEKQAIDISAQAGSMVGVEKEERLATHWSRSLKYRHPWLQINLMTAFVTGAVVSVFSGTINHSIVLAAFLPILASQASNTGCQALAVVLRGFTLGEFHKKKAAQLVIKEGFVGLLNGVLVGVVAAAGMFIFSSLQAAGSSPTDKKLMLSMVIFVAVTFSCMVAGVAGAIVPMAFELLGFDPVTASSIFLTTATDITSMGTMLALATLLVR